MMKQNIGCCSLIMAMLVAGCATTTQLTEKKQNQGLNPSDSRNSTSVVGSPEFSNSQKLKDPVKIHLAYATWLEQSGNYQEARASYLKVLEKSPKNSEAMIGLARIDRVYDREEEADARLKKALKLHPKDPKVLVAIGQVHALRNEWPEALQSMKAAHDIDPFDKVYEYHLAVVETHAGELNSAVEHFTRSVGQAEAYFNVGYILNQQGHNVEAEKYLKNALKLKPDLKQAGTTLAEMRSRKVEKAAEVQPASFNDKDRF